MLFVPKTKDAVSDTSNHGSSQGLAGKGGFGQLPSCLLDDLTVCELCLWHYKVSGEHAKGHPGS